MTAFDVVIVGGGAAGCATAASILKRRSSLSVAIIEPAEQHYYQPAWTLVGAGAFDPARTLRPMSRCIPRGVRWIKDAAAELRPALDEVRLAGGQVIRYRALVVAPGLVLDWGWIDGLEQTLGRNGVTSNYRFDLAPYTWNLVQALGSGRAIFTQPAMPIKCAGAPQKAVYLSCDHWRRKGLLEKLDVEFHATGAVLFGVPEFVPPLMEYVNRYSVDLNFVSTLTAVDGPGRRAWFDVKAADRTSRSVEKRFDFLHVVPPQRAPAFVSDGPLADAGGWLEVDPATLKHPRFPNVFSVGDASSSPNAKTAAAVRKQAPVAAENLIAGLDGREVPAVYDGYGSCPLTVERGKVILAEFGYGGKLLPSFPLDPTKPRRSAWALKTRVLPWVYFQLMLKGHEWLAKPTFSRSATPVRRGLD